MANWDDNIKRKVWNKCSIVPGKKESEYRLDCLGALIKWSEYGEYSDLGWQIDHIYPEKQLQDRGIKQEKIDDEINLQALNSFNNDTKSDDYPNFDSSKVYNTRIGKNIDTTKHWSVTETKQNMLKRFFGL